MSIYLDCAATTPIDPRVLAEVIRYTRDEFGNAASRTHDFGLRARRAVERARDQVAAVIACGRGDVLFTSGATESNNLAILGLAEHALAAGRKHLVTTSIEHTSVLEPLHHLVARGFELTLVEPTPGGFVDPHVICAALRKDTLLVSVMHVNNETGVIQPVDEIASALQDHPAFFHVDASQSFGKLIEPLRNERIDLISISAHKIHGPKGIGALITRRRNGNRAPLAPLLFGGGHERGLRPGTLPVGLIAGLGLAAELALDEHQRRNELCRAFGARLCANLAPLNPTYHGDQTRTVSQIVNLSLPGLDAEHAMEVLHPHVSLSNGSACTSSSEHCSHVLGAMRLPPEQAEGALRWSWCHMTGDPDWNAIRQVLAPLCSAPTGAR